MTVHGTHTRYRKSKGSVVPMKYIDVEFTAAASNGRKSADLTKCVVLNTETNCGWRTVNQQKGGTQGTECEETPA